MPLRNVQAFHDWITRESPSPAAQRMARHFIAEIGDLSWTWPSIPIARLSDQPEYEVREASLPCADELPVYVLYRHFYATDDVDLIAVTNG